jgi:hypothetical protein
VTPALVDQAAEDWRRGDQLPGKIDSMATARCRLSIPVGAWTILLDDAQDEHVASFAVSMRVGREDLHVRRHGEHEYRPIAPDRRCSVAGRLGMVLMLTAPTRHFEHLLWMIGKGGRQHGLTPCPPEGVVGKAAPSW